MFFCFIPQMIIFVFIYCVSLKGCISQKYQSADEEMEDIEVEEEDEEEMVEMELTDDEALDHGHRACDTCFSSGLS